jgi:hypothetical protein
MWALVAFYVACDFFMLMTSMDGRGGPPIAFAAHLAGAGYGFLYKTYDLRWSRLGGLLDRRPKLRVYRPEPSERARTRMPSVARTVGSGPAPAGVGKSPELPAEQLEAKVDEILAKIAREGPSSVTEDERRLLEEASQRARTRRGHRTP